MSVRVWYTTVYVEDFGVALAFYRDKVGLPLRFADEKFRYASFGTEGASFSIAGIQDPSQKHLVGRDTGIGLAVDDLEATYEEWKGRGVAFTTPPTKQPWGGTIAVLRDPEGNTIVLDHYDPDAR
jgi:predicted enzyme related to lactoylglutathione lyase